jgi:serine protease inhibitor
LLDALHVKASDAARIGALQRELAKRNGDGVTISQADRVWLHEQFELLASYTERLERDFDAPVGRLDFDDTAGSAATINKWVSEQTHGKIEKLVTPDMLDTASLVLTNAVYLDAKWEHPFLHEDTTPRQFHRGDGTTADVPTMKQSGSFKMGIGDGWRAIALPYHGDDVEMDVIVPDDLEGFERSLDGAQLDMIVGRLQPKEVDLYLPKFSLRARFDNLRAPLEQMGVKDAFDDEDADFSGMTGRRDQYLSAVVHEAFVQVDEEGTVAAAATGGVMRTTSMPAPKPESRVDKPFVFMVRDAVTGAVLFMGHVVDPAATG